LVVVAGGKRVRQIVRKNRGCVEGGRAATIMNY